MRRTRTRSAVGMICIVTDSVLAECGSTTMNTASSKIASLSITPTAGTLSTATSLHCSKVPDPDTIHRSTRSWRNHPPKVKHSLHWYTPQTVANDDSGNTNGQGNSHLNQPIQHSPQSYRHGEEVRHDRHVT